ncbi:MAG TPA: copper oxidase, partial [Mycobacteriales bacterium]|nr:copper oxidase [Mycobacteriales bacterium]
MTPPTIERGKPARPAGSALSPRAAWHRVAGALALAWAAAALLAAGLRSAFDVSPWLPLHLLLLGAATTAIVVWTEHFAVALLRAPAPPRRAAAQRLALLTAGQLTTVVGVSAGRPVVAGVGASGVLAAVAAHLAVLVRLRRGALSGRFAGTVDYYLAACVTLLLGGTLGAALALGVAGVAHDRILLAHLHLNLLGWVGLTVLGTQFTLWPTVLRTRMADGVVTAATRALWLLAAGLAATVVGVLWVTPVAVVGLVTYAAGVVVAVVPAVRATRSGHLNTGAAVAMALAGAQLFVALAVDAWTLLTVPLSTAAARFDDVLPLIVVGFVAQVLLGALTYLLPVVLGGGPLATRAATARLNRLWPARAVLLNVGVALAALPLPSAAQTAGWVAAAAAGAAFLALAAPLLVTTPAATPSATPSATAPAAPGASRPPTEEESTRPPHAPSQPPRAGRGAMWAGGALGAAMLLIAVLAAVTAGPRTPADTSTTAATGGTATVTVEARGMRYSPATIEVARGTDLTIVVVNHDGMLHDLHVEGRGTTDRIGEGERATLHVGVVDSPLDGWCTVGSHRHAGMVLTIAPAGAAARAPDGGRHGPGAVVNGFDPMAAYARGWKPYDPRLRPAPGGTEHRLTLEAVDRIIEVAPGVHQLMWTFGGTVPGPTLRGKVGDLFTVRLVNKGTTGHSID